MKIVLAEYNDQVRQNLSHRLRDAGHEVWEAEDGAKAVETVQQHNPDVVLLDPTMAKEDGARVLEELAILRPELPLLVFSKGSGAHEVMDTIRKGAWDIIVLPIQDLPALTTAMENAMKIRDMQYQAQEERLRLDKEAAELRDLWKSANRALEDKTIALREVLNAIYIEKQEYYRRIMSQVETAVLPILERAMEDSSAGVRTMLEEARTNLHEITSPFVEHLARRFSRLTPREVRVCQMIRRGKSSKDIAKVEGTAKETIDGHRKSIRRKLGIANSKVNLAAFLQSLEDAGPLGRGVDHEEHQ
jgi:DNA-binding NarL/FixJ family response regulator